MGVLHEGWMILAALLPSMGLLFLFWVILKNIVEADRRERAALREWDAAREAEKSTEDQKGSDRPDNSDSASGPQ